MEVGLGKKNLKQDTDANACVYITKNQKPVCF